MKKYILTSITILLFSFVSFAQIKSNCITTIPNVPLFSDTVTVVIDLNKTSEHNLLFLSEDLFMYPLNYNINPVYGSNSLSNSNDIFRMKEESSNIWTITFVPSQVFVNFSHADALKFTLKTKKNTPTDLISKSYFSIFFGSSIIDTAYLACDSLDIKYQGDINGTLSWWFSEDGSQFFDINKNNITNFKFKPDNLNGGILQAKITNQNCAPFPLVNTSNNFIIYGANELSSSPRLYYNSRTLPVSFSEYNNAYKDDNTNLLRPMFVDFNVPVGNPFSVNNVSFFKNGNPAQFIPFNKNNDMLSFYRRINNLSEGNYTAKVDFSEGCSETYPLTYARSNIYNIDTSLLWIYEDSLFAFTKPIYVAGNSFYTASWTQLELYYYNLSNFFLSDAIVTIKMMSPDSLYKQTLMNNSNNYLIEAPGPYDRSHGDFRIFSLAWNYPQYPNYLLHANIKLKDDTTRQWNYYTPITYGFNETGGLPNTEYSVSLRKFEIVNPKPSYLSGDTVTLRYTIIHDATNGAASNPYYIKSVSADLFNALDNEVVPLGGMVNNFVSCSKPLSSNFGSTAILTAKYIVPPVPTGINEYDLYGKFELEFSGGNCIYNINYDNINYGNLAQKVRIKVENKPAKIIITNISLSRTDTIPYFTPVYRSVTFKNVGGKVPTPYNNRDSSYAKIPITTNLSYSILPLKNLLPGEEFVKTDTLLGYNYNYFQWEKNPLYITQTIDYPYNQNVDTFYLTNRPVYLEQDKPNIYIDRFQAQHDTLDIHNAFSIYCRLESTHQIGVVNPLPYPTPNNYSFDITLLTKTLDTIYTTTVSRYCPDTLNNFYNFYPSTILVPQSITLPYNGIYYVAVKASIPAISEYSEQDNFAFDTLEITSLPGPDLEIVKFNPIGAGTVNSTVTLDSLVIRNNGDLASPPSQLVVLLDTIVANRALDLYQRNSGSVFDIFNYTAEINAIGGSIIQIFTRTDNNVGINKSIAVFNIPSIPAYSSIQIDTFRFNTDNLNLSPGWWRFALKLDETNIVDETDEKNNLNIYFTRIVDGPVLEYEVYSTISNNCGTLLSGTPLTMMAKVRNSGNKTSKPSTLIVRQPKMCQLGCLPSTVNIRACSSAGPSWYSNSFLDSTYSNPVLYSLPVDTIPPGKEDTLYFDVQPSVNEFLNYRQIGDITVPTQLLDPDSLHFRSLTGQSNFDFYQKKPYYHLGLKIGSPKVVIQKIDFDSLTTCGNNYSIRVTLKNNSPSFAQSTPFTVKAKHNFGLSQSTVVNSLAPNATIVLVFTSPVTFSGLHIGKELLKKISAQVELINVTTVNGLNNLTYNESKTIRFLRKSSPTLSTPTLTSSSPPTVAWNAVSGATRYKIDYKTPFGNELNNSTTANTSFKANVCSQSGNYTYSVVAYNNTCEYSSPRSGNYPCSPPAPPRPYAPPSGGSGNPPSSGSSGNQTCLSMKVKLEPFVFGEVFASYTLKNNCSQSVSVRVYIKASAGSKDYYFSDWENILSPGESMSNAWLAPGLDFVDGCIEYIMPADPLFNDYSDSYPCY